MKIKTTKHHNKSFEKMANSVLLNRGYAYNFDGETLVEIPCPHKGEKKLISALFFDPDMSNEELEGITPSLYLDDYPDYPEYGYDYSHIYHNMMPIFRAGEHHISREAHRFNITTMSVKIYNGCDVEFVATNGHTLFCSQIGQCKGTPNNEEVILLPQGFIDKCLDVFGAKDVVSLGIHRETGSVRCFCGITGISVYCQALGKEVVFPYYECIFSTYH